jgi:sterol desaturase/sphingolipid hydroxylase (fatty acid hydroxylase superfamily)
VLPAPARPASAPLPAVSPVPSLPALSSGSRPAGRSHRAPWSWAIAAATCWVIGVGALTLARAGRLGATLTSGRVELVGPIVVGLVALVVVCERLWPAVRRPLLARGHVQDAGFFVLYAVVVVPIMTLLGVGFAALLGTHARWIEAPWTASWPRWLLVVVTLVAMDGCNWLAHWVDHRVEAFWRFHAVHHSQEELSVLTSFRAHPFVHTIGFLLATVPVLALTGDHPLAAVLITVYVCLGTLPHANVSWTFGPLGRIVVSPAYHRVHHALDGPDGVNLGIVLTVWDVMSGRASFPARDTPAMATGLRGRPLPVEHSTVLARPLRLFLTQLTEPFAARRPMPERTTGS